MNEMLHSHRDGAVLCLTLHRPAAANALHSAMAGALMTALTAAALDDGIGAVVLSGAGERVFCAGADLKEHSELEQGAAALLRRETLLQTLLALLDFSKPLLCAVQARAITRARQWAAHAGPAHAGNKHWINRDLRAELIAAASEATRLQHSLSNRPSV